MTNLTAEHLIDRAARNYKAGAMNIWAVCFDASKIVGRYDRGATLQLAQRIKRSVDTVENYAVAGRTYTKLRQSLRRAESVRKLRACRSELSYLHFSKLGRRWERNGFGPSNALSYLIQASEENLNDQQLDQQIAADWPSNVTTQCFNLADFLSDEYLKVQAAIDEADEETDIEALQRLAEAVDTERARIVTARATETQGAE